MPDSDIVVIIINELLYSMFYADKYICGNSVLGGR